MNWQIALMQKSYVEHELENTAQDIKQAFHLFNKKDKSTKIIFATISVPEPVDDLFGDYFCYVSIELLLPDKRKLFGIDAFHAVIGAVKFMENFLPGPFGEAGRFADYEVRNPDGTSYQPLLIT